MYNYISGWWFGCHEFYFPIQLGMSYHPNWRNHIFQRGGPTTNQIFMTHHMCHTKPFQSARSLKSGWLCGAGTHRHSEVPVHWGWRTRVIFGGFHGHEATPKWMGMVFVRENPNLKFGGWFRGTPYFRKPQICTVRWLGWSCISIGTVCSEWMVMDLMDLFSSYYMIMVVSINIKKHKRTTDD